MKTLVRIIYLVQRIISYKYPQINAKNISHKRVNGLFINFPNQFVIDSFNTNVGINVVDIRLSCHLSEHNVGLMKDFSREIKRIIYDDYNVIQSVALSYSDKTRCKYKDTIGVCNHFITTDEITNETYNHILNHAFFFMNILPWKYKTWKLYFYLIINKYYCIFILFKRLK